MIQNASGHHVNADPAFASPLADSRTRRAFDGLAVLHRGMIRKLIPVCNDRNPLLS